MMNAFRPAGTMVAVGDLKVLNCYYFIIETLLTVAVVY